MIHLSPPKDKSLPIRLQENYDILDEIFRGNDYSVYRVRAVQDSRDYIVKVLKNATVETYQMFYREIETLADLKHWNILPITDYELVAETRSGYMATRKYISLRELIDVHWKSKDLAFVGTKITAILSGVSKALDSATFKKPLSHNNLKPENIFYAEEDGSFILGDWRYVKSYFDIVETANSPVKKGKGRVFAPKSIYTAPELMTAWNMNKDYKPKEKGLFLKTDVFSLGIVLLEVLRADPQELKVLNEMESETVYEALLVTMIDEIKSKWTYNNVIKIIKQMLSKEPNERPYPAQLWNALESQSMKKAIEQRTQQRSPERTQQRSPVKTQFKDMADLIERSPDEEKMELPIKPKPRKSGILPLWHAFSGPIKSVSWSYDGRMLAIGSADHSVRVFDVQGSSYSIFHSFDNVHRDQVTCVAWNPKSLLLASSSIDCSVKIHDIQTGTSPMIYDMHHRQINSIAWSPDGIYIVTGSSDLSVKIIDCSLKVVVYSYNELHKAEVLSVSWSSNGNLIATGSADKSLKVLNFTSKSVILTFDHLHDSNSLQNDAIKSVAWSKSGKYIASGSVDCSIRVIDFLQKRVIAIIEEAHLGIVHSVSWSRDDNYIASTGSDNALRIFDAKSHKVVKSFEPFHEDSALAVAWNPRENTIATGSADCTTKIINVMGKGTSCQIDGGHKGAVNSVYFSPNGKQFVTGSADCTVKIIDASKRKVLVNFHKVHARPITAMVWTSDGRFIASGSEDCTVKVFDPEQKKLVHVFDEVHPEPITQMVAAPKGSIIATGAYDHSIKILDLENKALLYSFFRVHQDCIRGLAWLAGGRYIVSSSEDKKSKIVDVTGKKVLDSLAHTQNSPIRSLVARVDDFKVATGSSDGCLEVFDLADKGRVMLTRDIVSINCLAWPRKHLIILGCSDNSIKAVEIKEDFVNISTVCHHSGPITTLGFSADGAFVVSGSKDGSLKVYTTSE